jgi:hypothetical protein
MRNSNTGGLEIYDISNNQVTGAAFMGTVGTDWQFAGVAPIHGPGTTDLVLRNVNTGQFEVYDIANNQIAGATSFGAVGLNWQVVGFGTLSNGTGSYMMVRNAALARRAYSRSIIFPTVRSRMPTRWVRSSARIGRLAVSSSIRRPAPWAARTPPLSSCKRWQVSAAAAPQTA